MFARTMSRPTSAQYIIIGIVLILQSLVVMNLLYVHKVLVPSPLFTLSVLGQPLGIVSVIVGIVKKMKRNG